MKLFVFLSFLIMGVFKVQAQTLCAVEWNSMIGKSSQGLDMKQLLSLWESKKDVCGESSFYYLKLGWFFLENSSFVEAERAFNKGLKADGENNIELELALADLPFQRATRAFDEVNYELIAQAQGRMESFVQAHPNLPEGYGLLTGLMLVKEDFGSVIEYGNRARELGGDNYAYRNLAIAYERTGKHQESITAYSKISDLAYSLETDIDFMLSIALAYSNLGEFEKSIEALNKLAKANSNAQPMQKFQDAAIYIRNKYLAEQG